MRTIVLFGADWCAPCLAELRDLPVLAQAAAPDRLTVAWVDGNPRIPAGVLRQGVRTLAPAAARDLFERHGAGNAGLPLVVMLDAEGNRCGMLRQRLSDAGLSALRASCAASDSGGTNSGALAG